MKFRGNTVILLAISALAISIDQLAKYFLTKIPDKGIFMLKSYLTISIAPTDNPYLTWGIKMPQAVIFAISAISIAVLIVWAAKSIISHATLDAYLITLITSGAISNLMDRIVGGAVKDFISIKIFNFYWPTFNIADILIVISAITLISTQIKKQYA